MTAVSPDPSGITESECRLCACGCDDDDPNRPFVLADREPSFDEITGDAEPPMPGWWWL